MPAEDVEKLMHRQQKQRDHFTRDFLSRNDHDPALYDLLFNNDRCTPEKIARTMAEYIVSQ
jgi:chloramphenicol 3-O-phosphotransferase